MISRNTIFLGKIPFPLRACLLAAVAVLALAVSGDGARAFGPTVVKLATVEHERSPVGGQLREFGRYLEAAAEGLARIKLFTGGSLGDERQLLRRTAEGSLQVVAASAEGLAGPVPETELLGSAFLFANERHARRALDGPVRELLRPRLQGQGLEPGPWIERGFRSWYTKNKSVHEPEDLYGLRLPAEKDSARAEVLRRLGALPVAQPTAGVSESLASGGLDGFEATPSEALASSWYRGTGHLTLSRHSYRAGVIVYSGKWLRGLPEALRQALSSVPRQIRKRARERARSLDARSLEILRQRGVEIHQIRARQRRRLVRATRKPLRAVAREMGREGQKLLRAVKVARQRPGDRR